jgi:hypothetical protein
MAAQMNALLAQQLMPTQLPGGLRGLPAINPIAAQMNALLGQQLQPTALPGGAMGQGGLPAPYWS